LPNGHQEGMKNLTLRIQGGIGYTEAYPMACRFQKGPPVHAEEKENASTTH